LVCPISERNANITIGTGIFIHDYFGNTWEAPFNWQESEFAMSNATTEHDSSQTHAIMFHHFHDARHAMGQGSLSAQQFELMIEWLSDRYHLLSADEYQFKLKQQKLAANDICLTFDDALLCQAEIAAPILKKKNIRAYFFVYSSPFMGNPDYLEIYRHFRTTKFDSIDDFYEKFFQKTKSIFTEDYTRALSRYEPHEYLKAYAFYTDNDKWFRFLRDGMLGKERYEEIMRLLMASTNFDPAAVINKLWMNNNNLVDLVHDGHIIGLHSYTHPTTLHLLDKRSQQDEYNKNYQHLRELLHTSPSAMSHPCGNYNHDTLQILHAKKIEIGFRSNNSIKEIRSNLEIPREDHANILREMSR